MGASTVGLNSVAGYTNGEVAVFVIDPSNSSKQTFTGTIDTSGVQVTNVVWTAGTNTTHAAGATVVDYATATHISMITKGLLVEHKQSGAHSDITADSITMNASGSVDFSNAQIDTADIADSAITPEKLISGTGSNWAWQDWTPTYTNFSLGNGTVDARYTQIGKTVHFTISIVLGSTSSMTGSMKLLSTCRGCVISER